MKNHQRLGSGPMARSSLVTLAAVVVMMLTGAFLTGCNTVEGMGKDVEQTGEEIQDAAD